ncbi:Tat (twin-arginine translocation) pathway signal sequence containing protein [Algoriphagus sp. D3-2-R+10]|uniref:Tat (twin-arginine translocation) pathway signal sequence containing protein n=1 Tax=Algoriphagus aurantiacus TaxID=3103948 RepID=UPI002B3F99A3|nr:Tat (twin-arginine translocation) pathway signal sequence containing protein [Algoriphagus sp. D3-2-R+10]MEB2776640.1 Tat (twin-arginine translocation) pathway signal sequence containing protein [Algoriphagus sp. D3-2-R+10]
MENINVNSRRKFLGTLAATASMSSVGTAVFAEEINGNSTKFIHEADEWFKKIKGSHRVVYDGSTPHDGFAIIWNWAFYLSNNQTGSEDSDITAMSVLRHSAIPFALKSELWEKYNLGEFFGVMDNKTQKPSLRNPYYEPQEGDFPVPIIQGIKELQARGAMFCVCDLALSVYGGAKAQQIGEDATTVYEEWKNGVLPGIQIVPSGVWALGRAQENGCGYIFAGN